jgi:hypothetical protein
LRVSSPYRNGGTGRALTVTVGNVVDIGFPWLGFRVLDGFCGIGRALDEIHTKKTNLLLLCVNLNLIN